MGYLVCEYEKKVTVNEVGEVEAGFISKFGDHTPFDNLKDAERFCEEKSSVSKELKAGKEGLLTYYEIMTDDDGSVKMPESICVYAQKAIIKN